jgi:hypothetical protein
MDNPLVCRFPEHPAPEERKAGRRAGGSGGRAGPGTGTVGLGRESREIEKSRTALSHRAIRADIIRHVPIHAGIGRSAQRWGRAMREPLQAFVKRVGELAEHVRGNEQATKQSLVGPLYIILKHPLTGLPEEIDG